MAEKTLERIPRDVRLMYNRATEALQRIAQFYQIETGIRGSSADERQAVRQQKTKPLVEALKTWLDKTLPQLAHGSPIAKAIRYALNQWDGLIRFLDDGRIEIDSNVVERSIRPIALNRKNALFAGSDEGGDNWAVIATLIECCKINAVNPHQWLTETLIRLADGHPANSVGELMPWTVVP